MQEKLNIAVFVDYDNIEIGVKSTLRREFDVSLPLDALKERGDLVAKFAYANWGRQEGAARSMAENAVQMVQRLPSPRGDKNGGDINLALDALEMAFTHPHVNAFAIVSGDSDFIPLVNKLKEYGKTVFVVGGKAFHQHHPATELSRVRELRIAVVGCRPRSRLAIVQPRQQQQAWRRPGNASKADIGASRAARSGAGHAAGGTRAPGAGTPRGAAAARAAEIHHAAARFGVYRKSLRRQQLLRFRREAEEGRLRQRERAGRALHHRAQDVHQPERPTPKPEEALPPLRDVLETHRLEMENGASADDLAGWVQAEVPNFSAAAYGFQEFSEFLNYAQDKLVVRVEPDEEKGLMVYLGAEFYPPAVPEAAAGAARRRGRGREAAHRGRPAVAAGAESSAGQAEAGPPAAEAGGIGEYRPASPYGRRDAEEADAGTSRSDAVAI